jgi:hypothetical protein
MMITCEQILEAAWAEFDDSVSLGGLIIPPPEENVCTPRARWNTWDFLTNPPV